MENKHPPHLIKWNEKREYSYLRSASGKVRKLKALDTQANCEVEVKQDREIWVTFSYSKY